MFHEAIHDQEVYVELRPQRRGAVHNLAPMRAYQPEVQEYIVSAAWRSDKFVGLKAIGEDVGEDFGQKALKRASWHSAKDSSATVEAIMNDRNDENDESDVTVAK